MNWEKFEQLLAQARSVPGPKLDVRERVARSIAELRIESESSILQPLLVTTSSLALAAGVALLCFPTWSAETSAMAYLFESLVTILP